MKSNQQCRAIWRAARSAIARLLCIAILAAGFADSRLHASYVTHQHGPHESHQNVLAHQNENAAHASSTAAEIDRTGTVTASISRDSASSFYALESPSDSGSNPNSKQGHKHDSDCSYVCYTFIASLGAIVTRPDSLARANIVIADQFRSAERSVLERPPKNIL